MKDKATAPLAVPAIPCSTCPYRRDTPAGIWHVSEYAKLPLYDDNRAFEVFLCHHSRDANRNTVCRGWLTVHRESVAARLAECRGLVTGDERYAECPVPLYASGTEAAAAGMAGIKQPSQAAIAKIKTLSRKLDA